MADIKSQPNDSTEVSLRKAVDLLGNIEDKTNTLVVGELEVKNTSGDPLAVSGTVTANAGTGTFAVSAASLPLPSGAATSANQATAITSLSNIDTDLGAPADSVASTDTGSFSLISLFKRLLGKIPNLSGGRIPVTVSGDLTAIGVYGLVGSPTPVLAGGMRSTIVDSIKLDPSSGRLLTEVSGFSATSLPLPAGAATSANQTTSNTSLASIDGKLPSSLASDRLKVDGSGVTQPVSGTVTADSNRGNLTAASTQSITEGGTSQQLFDINNSRKYLVIQNISDTAMYLGIGFTPSSSTPRGLLLAANGGGIVFDGSYIPTGAVNIVCASTGKRFEAFEA